jgi:pimeloyl-ACP methyl ester carboxylesterase
MSKVDYDLIFKSGITGKFIAAAYQEGCRSGTRGLAYEASLYMKPWGFDLQSIPIKVHLWHGETDLSAPKHQALTNARLIPNRELQWASGEGHITTWYKCHAEILQTLAA